MVKATTVLEPATVAFWAAAARPAPICMPVMAVTQAVVVGVAMAQVPTMDLVRAVLVS